MPIDQHPCMKIPFTTRITNMFLSNSARFPVPGEICPGKTIHANPGSYVDIHSNVADIMAEWIVGARLEGKLRFNQNKVLGGTVTLSHLQPSGFNIGGYYSPSFENGFVAPPELFINFNPTTFCTYGAISCQPKIFENSKFLCRLSTNQVAYAQRHTLKLDRFGQNSTTSLHAIKQTNEREKIKLGHLHSITDNLAVGGELLFAWKNSLDSLKTFVTLAAKYHEDTYSIATTFSMGKFDVTAWKLLSENIQIGTWISYDKPHNKHLASCFYQLRTKDSRIRGMFDTGYRIGVVYDIEIPKLFVTLGLNVLYDIKNNKMTTGIRISADPEHQFL